MTSPRLLVVLGQSPLDTASGAAQSTFMMAVRMAAAGWNVRVLATTASEGHVDQIDLARDLLTESEERDNTICGWHKGVCCELFKVPLESSRRWYEVVGADYDARFQELLQAWWPTVLLTFGGAPHDLQRLRRARKASVTIAFALHNLAYIDPRNPASVRECLAVADHLIAPSKYVAERYASEAAIQCDVLEPPIDWAETQCDVPHEQRPFALFVNPEPAKGLQLIVTLASLLGKERPDIPLLIVESRGRKAHLLAAAKRGGIHLERFDNVMISTGGVSTRELFSVARVLLMPSVWNEPAGRLPLEAMVNGIPSIVSERGALPEFAGPGSMILPLPDELTMGLQKPISERACRGWFDCLTELFDNLPHYESLCRAARAEAERRLHPDIQSADCVQLFERYLGSS